MKKRCFHLPHRIDTKIQWESIRQNARVNPEELGVSGSLWPKSLVSLFSLKQIFRFSCASFSSPREKIVIQVRTPSLALVFLHSVRLHKLQGCLWLQRLTGRCLKGPRLHSSDFSYLLIHSIPQWLHTSFLEWQAQSSWFTFFIRTYFPLILHADLSCTCSSKLYLLNNLHSYCKALYAPKKIWRGG